MFKRIVALSIILTACSTTPVVTEPQTADTTASTSTAETGAVSSSTNGQEPEPDLLADNATIFVASLEETVAGTIFEGAILDSPEVFIAAGEIMCERLDAGDSIDGTLTDYLNGLLEADDELTEEDVIVLAGGVLGASVQLFCPQHTALIEEKS